jgi:mannose-1-phosphate guanylyltransferase
VEAAAEGYLVTFGIVPTRAETGYGYIVPGDTLGEARRIERFVEKPEPDIAMRLSTEGALWNSGMFAFPVGLLLAELGLHRPGVVEAARASLPAGIPASGRLELSAAFAGAESVSIDVAVMQSTKRGLVVPLDAGWSDVGSWESMWELGDHDAQGNVRSGKVLDMGTSRSYLHSTGPLLAAIDVEDLIVVATGDAVLVARRDSAQDVKTLVHRIEAEQLEGLSGGAAGPSADDSESLQ